jgi:hypothetical protein
MPTILSEQLLPFSERLPAGVPQMIAGVGLLDGSLPCWPAWAQKPGQDVSRRIFPFIQRVFADSGYAAAAHAV